MQLFTTRRFHISLTSNTATIGGDYIWGTYNGRPMAVSKKEIFRETIRTLVKHEQDRRYAEDLESSWASDWKITDELQTEEEQFVQKYGKWD